MTRAEGEQLKHSLSMGARIRWPVLMIDGEDSERYLSSFSGRGPTKDMRLKPDVVAPGQRITSSRSDGTLDSSQCDPIGSSTLKALSGTSMAAPVAAAAAVLVRQYFVDGHYPRALSEGAQDDPDRDYRHPSAALIKAMLIQSGVAMGGTVTTKLAKEKVTPPPSYFQGHGRIQLNKVCSPH